MPIKLPGEGRRIGIIGAPVNYGAGLAGVDLGPAAMRIARLIRRIENLGYQVNDWGDIKPAASCTSPDSNEKLKHLNEITSVCEELSGKVQQSLIVGELPVILGGDHSIAIGSISGIASFYQKQQKEIGLIWFDAHADMNTPQTTPSGNIHGMPLAVLLGYGVDQLTNLTFNGPKLNPQYCAHIGARDVDAGERELIERLGLRFFTMREIDERGMNFCMNEAIAIASMAPAGYHVTLDVDVLDPGDAPGSGTVVRGGLTYREAHLAMEKIAESGRMCSLEVVEINTTLDINNRTAELGVELILSALGKTIL
jgi:arginase